MAGACLPGLAKRFSKCGGGSKKSCIGMGEHHTLPEGSDPLSRGGDAGGKGYYFSGGSAVDWALACSR